MRALLSFILLSSSVILSADAVTTCEELYAEHAPHPPPGCGYGSVIRRLDNEFGASICRDSCLPAIESFLADSRYSQLCGTCSSKHDCFEGGHCHGGVCNYDFSISDRLKFWCHKSDESDEYCGEAIHQIEHVLKSTTVHKGCDTFQQLIDTYGCCVTFATTCNLNLGVEVDTLCHLAATCPQVHIPEACNAVGFDNTICLNQDEVCSDVEAYQCSQDFWNNLLEVTGSIHDKSDVVCDLGDLSEYLKTSQALVQNVITQYGQDNVDVFCSDNPVISTCRQAFFQALHLLKQSSTHYSDACSYIFFRYLDHDYTETSTVGANDVSENVVDYIPMDLLFPLISEPICEFGAYSTGANNCLLRAASILLSDVGFSCEGLQALGCCASVIGNCYGTLLFDGNVTDVCQLNQQCKDDGWGDMFPDTTGDNTCSGNTLSCDILCLYPSITPSTTSSISPSTTPSESVSGTSSSSESPTPSTSATSSLTATQSATRSASRTASVSPSTTVTATLSASSSAIPSGTPSGTPSSSRTPSVSPSSSKSYIPPQGGSVIVISATLAGISCSDILAFISSFNGIISEACTLVFQQTPLFADADVLCSGKANCAKQSGVPVGFQIFTPKSTSDIPSASTLNTLVSSNQDFVDQLTEAINTKLTDSDVSGLNGLSLTGVTGVNIDKVATTGSTDGTTSGAVTFALSSVVGLVAWAWFVVMRV